MVEVVDQIRDAASCLQNLLATFKRLEESNALRVTCNGSTTSGLKARVRELEAQVDERAHETARLRGQVHDLEGQIRHVVEQKDVEIAKLHARLESLDEQLKQAESDREGSDEWTPKSPHHGGSMGYQFEDDFDDDDPPVASPDAGSPSVRRHRASFSLLQCSSSDNVRDVFIPPHRTIRTKCHAKNNVQMTWTNASRGPKTILLVKKPNEPTVAHTMREVATWLMAAKHMRVFLEPVVHAEEGLDGTLTWTDAADWHDKQHEIDLVVSFGGDGTVLWVSSLFKTNVPPVFSFAMGSLGFLTPFEVARYEDDSQIDTTANAMIPIHALNEVVVDRGLGAALVELDCFCDDVALTKISADGIIIASPTGSTAYSLSAGGSMTHPSAVLKIVVPATARSSSVMVSFDGKMRVQMNRGDALEVRVSPFPLPSVCNLNENEDWFASVKSNLYWNQRKEIKPFHDVPT
ncbi:hypothetical protein DYB37_010372 [Aphanomyces astaci]|uniref:Uncharacterized protein n=1 Tax=Aphanomyces astaci TaxID=112090 RepID=A0A418E4I0_APHAT|nr:hypothetical protein DYB35_009988 [Aphanomyces astaci]RHZ05856.1 hypothetical protein DYB37_010372 [Aphanomyces astaci]